MRLIDSCPPDPQRNIALDASLFQELEEGGRHETLRFWEARQPGVVIGSFGAVGREIDEGACLADGVPVIRRTSGGGAVVVGPGCFNYSLLLSLDARPALRHVSRSYHAILGVIVRALAVPGLQVEGMSDLAVGGRKVAGSAQRRGRRALLHHGTVLYAFDVSIMERYLKEPARQPVYRAGRRHAAFVTNVAIDPAALAAALVRGFGRPSGSLPGGPEGPPLRVGAAALC